MGKKGRPKKAFTREQLDRAKYLLGRRQYPSRVAAALKRKWPDLGVNKSYELIEAAQQEVYEQLAGDGSDMLTSTCLFLKAVMGESKERTRDKVAAAAVLVKLLGMHKLIKNLQEAGDVEAFLAAVVERRAARAGETGGRE